METVKYKELKQMKKKKNKEFNEHAQVHLNITDKNQGKSVHITAL